MFEIEAHYHDRKIYLSDGRVYPLGEILLRYFSMNFYDLGELFDVCERAKSELNISSLFCPADISKRKKVPYSVRPIVSHRWEPFCILNCSNALKKSSCLSSAATVVGGLS